MFGYLVATRHARQAYPDIPHRPYLDPWFRWDAGWYMSIIRQGYSLHEPVPGQHNTVFFPLYPMLSRGVAWLFQTDPMWGAFLVSNVCFIAAALVLYRWVSEQWDRRTALSTVLLLSTAPHAFYFSAGYTESVFLLMWVAAFYAAHRRAWFTAAVFIALSGATRLVGVVAIAGVGLVALEQANWSLRKLSPRVLWLALGVTGLLGFAAFLHFQLGNAWLFTGTSDVAGWGKERASWEHFVNAFGVALNPVAWRSGHVDIANTTHLILLTLATVVAVTSRKRIGLALVIFSLLTLGVYWRVWFSASRYVLTLFPLYVSMAVLLRRRPFALQALLLFDTLLLGHFTWLYNIQDWVS